MIGLRWLSSVLLGVLVTSLVFFVVVTWQLSSFLLPRDAASLKLEVKAGDGLHRFASQLYSRGLIRQPRVFVLGYRLFYGDKPLLKGNYLVHAKDSQFSLIKKLGLGLRLTGRFTIIEGWRWQQLIHALQQDKRLVHQAEQACVQYFSRLFQCDMKQTSDRCLEGRFLAGTYYFYEGSDDISILHTANDAMEKTLNHLWRGRHQSLRLKSPYEALIVASLIQKESAYLPEYGKISAVIQKRLALDMPLQIDSAVLYGLGRLVGPLMYRDLKKVTPYNNYKQKGLPPTPIAMVGEAALKAAIFPDLPNPYLYYVANGEGGHHFTATHAQHVRMKHYYKQQSSK